MEKLTLSRYIINKSPRSQLDVILDRVYKTLLNQSILATLLNNKPVGEIVTWIIISSSVDPLKNMHVRVECDKLDKERITLTHLNNIIASELRDQEKLGDCEYVTLGFYFIISEDEFPKELINDVSILFDFEETTIKEFNLIDYS